ncbi:MAG TPA: divalent-cation tolerance protein CutA [Anaerolineales bacterium]|nr:divalent-cation tolerance protein CutA [Anaerolineales bacterium]
MMEACLVTTTTNDAAEAGRLSEELVRQGLAACVQRITVESQYVWEGRIEQQPEFLLCIKTSRERHDEVEAYLRRAHSYAVPEILCFSAAGGSADYLAWIRDNSQGRRVEG